MSVNNSDYEKSAPSINDFLVLNDSSQNVQGNSYARVLLDNFLNYMNGVGDDAQDQYERSLVELRSNSEDVLLEIARLEKACDQDDFSTRWALIYAATQIRNIHALPLLRHIVSTPIPPERSKSHSFSTVAEETILRTTAIEGIKHLATYDNKLVLEALFHFLKQSSISIRRATVQAIFSIRNDEESRLKVAQELPSDMQFLIDIKPVDVRDIPQISNVEHHLKKTEQRVEKESIPRLGKDESTNHNDGTGNPEVN